MIGHAMNSFHRRRHKLRSKRGALPLVATALAIAACALACSTSGVATFVFGKQGAASLSAALLLSAATSASAPALAETLEKVPASIKYQDSALLRQYQDMLTLKSSEIEGLTKEELELTRKQEQEKLAQSILEERQLKASITAYEQQQKAEITAEEKAKKAKVDADLIKQLAEIDKKEQEAKNAATDILKKEKDAAKKITSAEARQTAYFAAVDKALDAIDAATRDSKASVTQAYQNARLARESIGESAETQRRAAGDSAESGRMEVGIKGRLTERGIVESQNKLNIQIGGLVVEAKLEEFAYLEAAGNFLTTVGGIVFPIVAPGVGLLIYAVIMSFAAPAPDPCKGAETEDDRVRMGRPARPKTVPPTADPWTDMDLAVQ